MATEFHNLKPRNLIALGLVGFSGAFAIFLLYGLYVEHGNLTAAALNLGAAVLLIAVFATSWQIVSRPRQARVSWRFGAMIALAFVLALAARLPKFQA